MEKEKNLKEVRDYFQKRLDEFGATPRGADWNSVQSQFRRFAQLAKVIINNENFTILDYGCGYGAFADYLDQERLNFSRFFGFDILETMITKAKEIHSDQARFFFSSNLNEIPNIDYAVASGVFNIRTNASYHEWTEYVLFCLQQINQKVIKGFASNFLTKYSDPEKMVASLYYADPCYIFDYCKTHFSKNVALLHDYDLYDFTIIVRKPGD